MKKYTCTLQFTYSPDKVGPFLTHALKPLAFLPGVMYIRIDNEDRLEDEPYNEELLFSILSRKPTTIQLMNKAYDEMDDYYWFRMQIDESYNILRAEWLNSNLDFLFSKESLGYFLQSKDFICGNCCDNADRYEQSRERSEYFVNRNPTKPYDKEKIEGRIRF